MKLVIKPAHWHPFVFWAPLGVLKWKIWDKKLAEVDVGISAKDLYDALKEEKRRYGKLLLVEATSPDGVKVKIYL